MVMKKIATTLLLALSLMIGYAQNVAYAKGTTLNVGIKNTYSNEFEWAGPQVINPVIISIGETEVSITSAVYQHYTIYSESDEIQVKGTAVYWYAYDLNGQRCRIYLMENEVGDDFLAIEYDDFAWIYNLIPIK